jgi:hypothetical protein
MTPDQFVTKYAGQLVKSSEGISGQCVSISALWGEVNGWPGVFGPTALSIFYNFNNPAYIKLLVGTPAKPGDIVFFGPPYGQSGNTYYGHTGLVVSASKGGLTVFQQNDPDGSSAHIKTYPYTNVLGYFRPVGETMPTLTPEAIINQFAGFGVPGPTQQQISDYVNHGDWGVLNGDLLSYNTNRLAASLANEGVLTTQIARLTAQLSASGGDAAKKLEQISAILTE